MTPAIYSHRRGAEVSGTAIGSVPYRKKFLDSKLREFDGRLALIRGLPLQQRQLLLRYCVVTTLIHLTRTLRSDDPSIIMMEVWARANALVDAELASLLSSPVEGLVPLPLLTQLPMCLGGFGVPHYQTIVPSAYTSASSAVHQFLGKIGLRAPLHSVPPSHKDLLKLMHAQMAVAVRTALPIQYHSTLDDHCNTYSYVFLTACPTSPDLMMTDAEYRVSLDPFLQCWSHR